MLIFVSLAFSVNCAVLSYPSHLLDEENVLNLCVCVTYMYERRRFVSTENAERMPTKAICNCFD